MGNLGNISDLIAQQTRGDWDLLPAAADPDPWTTAESDHSQGAIGGDRYIGGQDDFKYSLYLVGGLEHDFYFPIYWDHPN